MSNTTFTLTTFSTNISSTTNYVDQITERLNQYYSNPPKRKTPIERLKLRRNQLRKEMRAIVEKFFGIKEECFSRATVLVNQTTELNLSIDILDELLVNKEQEEFWTELTKKDTYLSKLCRAYQKELIELDLQIISLESQSTLTLPLILLNF